MPLDAVTIETRDLTKVFARRACVDHLNIKVHAGELYALLGENGAGKTTTINMLTTLLKPTSGSFLICGHDGLKEPEKAKSCFGVVSQDVAIYQELTAYENLKFTADLYGIARPEADRRIKDQLEKAGLIDRINDRAGEFSGGMQRKLSIASCLIHTPRVLFMDEPTVGLDPASRRQIWASLIDLRTMGVTIFLTTHYLEEAELLADRIGIIRQGKLSAEGTIDQLRKKIRGIQGIAVRLTDRLSETEVERLLSEILEQFGSKPRYDQLRNTITISQPHDTQLLDTLKHFLSWLESKEISFSRFSTSEPNLEEVFLAISEEEELGGL